MSNDSRRSLITIQGKKVYRLKIALARLKPELKQQPNYSDENEIEETTNAPILNNTNLS